MGQRREWNGFYGRINPAIHFNEISNFCRTVNSVFRGLERVCEVERCLDFRLGVNHFELRVEMRGKAPQGRGSLD